MSMSIGWLDDDKTVVYRRIEGEWTWDEFYATHEQAMKMMSSVEHSVSLLSEFVDNAALMLPKQLFSHAHHLLKDFPDNYNLLIFVVESQIAQSMLSSISKVIPHKTAKHLRVVNTMTQAYDLLGITLDHTTTEEECVCQ